MRQLYVDEQFKQEVHKAYIQSRKALYLLPYILIIIAVVCTIRLLIYGSGNAEALIIKDVTDSDFGKKNMLLLFFIIGTIDVILVFLYAVTKIAIYRITGKYISERIHETLQIKEDHIEYGYQNFAGSVPGDRVVVQIPFTYIDKITCNPQTKEVVFTGKYSSKYYEDYEASITRADDRLISGDFTMFDYFVPSLMDSLSALITDLHL